jgi:hypothetical protein
MFCLTHVIQWVHRVPTILIRFPIGGIVLFDWSNYPICQPDQCPLLNIEIKGIGGMFTQMCQVYGPVHLYR